MNDFDQSFLAFQAAERTRRCAEDWLGAFETALQSRDAARIGALFHHDCHWRDILAFTWHLTPVAGRDNVATRLAAEQERTAAHGFHLPASRRPPRNVKRLGIDSVEAIFAFRTAFGRGAGIIRLHALCEAFLSYLERAVFPGGCFFASAMAEFDSKAPGPVRDRIAQCQDQWMNTLERAARQAQDREELHAGGDPRQLAFELEAALLSANWYFHLFSDATYLDRARRAVRARLASEATPAGLHLLPPDP